MKSAHEIFLTVGVPIPRRYATANLLDGFRAFNEHDIAEIQRDAIEHGKSLIRDDPMIKKLLNLSKASCSPVTHNPQEDAFYERAEKDVKP